MFIQVLSILLQILAAPVKPGALPIAVHNTAIPWITQNPLKHIEQFGSSIPAAGSQLLSTALRLRTDAAHHLSTLKIGNPLDAVQNVQAALQHQIHRINPPPQPPKRVPLWKRPLITVANAMENKAGSSVAKYHTKDPQGLFSNLPDGEHIPPFLRLKPKAYEIVDTAVKVSLRRMCQQLHSGDPNAVRNANNLRYQAIRSNPIGKMFVGRAFNRASLYVLCNLRRFG